MTSLRLPQRSPCSGLTVAALLLSFVGEAVAVVAPAFDDPRRPLPDMDVRGIEAMGRNGEGTPVQRAALAAFKRELKSIPGGPLVTWFGPQPGTLHHLFRRGGFLTAAPVSGARDAESIAREFLARHAELLGLGPGQVKQLALVRKIVDPGTEAVHLMFEQRIDGIEIYHGELRVHLDRSGRILSVGGDTAPSAVLSSQVLLTPGLALAAASANVRVPLATTPVPTRKDAEGRWHFKLGPYESEPWVDETWFPKADGVTRAYRVVVDPADDQGWYQVIVDARNGEVLARFDLVENIATEGLAFREDPGQGPQLLFDFVDDTVLTDPDSPLGWSEAGESRGNNCDVKDDIAADNEGTEGLRAVASGPDPLSFSFPFMDDPGQDLEASITNLFYLNNWLHDRAARLGFDEPSGNFQNDNFGRGGRGGDAVRVDAQDGSGTNNANFGTPPDGSPPRMQMFIWTRTNPNRDSGFDSSVITHELFHGVSNRLVGGGDNAGCLGIPQGGAMGEAWSDFFACSFWDQPSVGGYLINNYVRGIRRAPYDNHPFDYSQLCNQGGFQVHRDGEIWAATLWGLRDLFKERYGSRAGRCKIERLVLDGMKLAPCRPTYLDMRDAILLAGQLRAGDGDLCLLWEGFAARGLGIDAVRQTACTSADDASYDVPVECTTCMLDRPAITELSTSVANTVSVSFTLPPEASEGVLLRAPEDCLGDCFDTTFEEVARGASPLLDVDANGNRLSVGQSYSYRVMAVEGASCTAYSDCASASVTGRCTLLPVSIDGGPLGVTGIERPAVSDCTITVHWAEAASVCTAATELRYNVYRSDAVDFAPGPEHLVASVSPPATSYVDAAAPEGDLTYVVRVEDLTTGGLGPHGGNEEPNERRLTLSGQGPINGETQFADDGEGGELPGYQRTGTFEPNDWALVSDGNTRGGSAWHVTGQNGGTADKNLVLPRLSLGATPSLSFLHTFDFENNFDGGVIDISTDGGQTFTDLINDITSGGYDTSAGSGRSLTVGPIINPPNVDELWTGENAAGFANYDLVEVDLSPYANTLDVQIRLRCLLDANAFDPGGWYVDELFVDGVSTFDACTSACTDPPTPVLPPRSGCAAAGEDTLLSLDAAGSSPGASGWAAELSHVFTHDGPGSFDGRRWASGPTATLSFPPGTPPGDYTVTLTVRGADTCAASIDATVTVEEGTLPTESVANTLRVSKAGDSLDLVWTAVDAPAYNVHAAMPGEDLSDMAALGVLSGSTTADLSLSPAESAGELLFLKVFAATSCGSTVP